MPRIQLCRFPVPAQEPPVSMPEPCSAKCPRFDASTLQQHATIAQNDPELLAAIASFAEWLYEPGQDLRDQVRYAAELYTREDHSGTCIPKTVLFAHYKHLQFDSYAPLQLSSTATRAIRGETVEAWPDGEACDGDHWNQMFADYSRRYL